MTLVDESLFLLRETASELTFDAGAIDRERGVVLSEWRRGDNFQRRRNDQELRLPDAGRAGGGAHADRQGRGAGDSARASSW